VYVHVLPARPSVIASGGQVPPTTNPASATVCDGWERPVADLMALGLMNDVIRRLNALAPADRVVYVTGHSRGGALVGVACDLCASASVHVTMNE
jgi:hypothetical protein